MENEQTPRFSVSSFLAVINQALEVAFGVVEVEGEVSSFKVNHQKYVFFDLKDEQGLVNCFMTVWQLRVPIEDGMRVIVRASPKVTDWGKFSLTVQAIRPVGEGSLKKSFEILKDKLTKEGLFDESRKRELPERPKRVAVITSTQSAGYVDFVKIANQRLGGTKFFVYHTRVQGDGAADDIIQAIDKSNQASQPYQALVIIRGGGSQEDLAVFNDEKLVRAIASSRSPVLTGIGHEIDETLADFVADVRAATPSEAAFVLLPDRQAVLNQVDSQKQRMLQVLQQKFNDYKSSAMELVSRCRMVFSDRLRAVQAEMAAKASLLESFNPEAVLARGYALIRGKVEVGSELEIVTKELNIYTEVKRYDKRTRTDIG